MRRLALLTALLLMLSLSWPAAALAADTASAWGEFKAAKSAKAPVLQSIGVAREAAKTATLWRF